MEQEKSHAKKMQKEKKYCLLKYSIMNITHAIFIIFGAMIF